MPARIACTALLALACGLAGACADRTPEAGAGAGTAVGIPQGAPERPAGALAPPPTTRAAVVDAAPLAGLAELGIRSALGNPSACEAMAIGRRCRYAPGATDVVFIDGVADGIHTADLGGAPFSAAALARVGLPVDEDPIEATGDYIRWQNLAGFRQVTLFRGPDGRAGRIEMKRATL